MFKLAALYVETNGIYFKDPEIDPWDQIRDARKYAGPYAVIAHPPCNRWCKYARVNQTRYGIPVGADDGCFEGAVNSILKYGGVLEHPAQSIAFDKFNIGKPAKDGWIESPRGGFICQVYQGQYGHKAPKPTWLWVVGITESDLPKINHAKISTGVSCTPLTGVPSLPPKERSATPKQFKELLKTIALKVPKTLA